MGAGGRGRAPGAAVRAWAGWLSPRASGDPGTGAGRSLLVSAAVARQRRANPETQSPQMDSNGFSRTAGSQKPANEALAVGLPAPLR